MPFSSSQILGIRQSLKERCHVSGNVVLVGLTSREHGMLLAFLKRSGRDLSLSEAMSTLRSRCEAISTDPSLDRTQAVSTALAAGLQNPTTIQWELVPYCFNPPRG